MSGKRLGAVFLIYAVAALAWLILGGTNQVRSSQTYSRLSQSDDTFDGGRAGVQDLWGQPQVQRAPAIGSKRIERVTSVGPKGRIVSKEIAVDEPVVPDSSRLDVNIKSEPRRKGLLWYNTYSVQFTGDYVFTNNSASKRTFYVKFAFPAQKAIYDDVSLEINGRRIDAVGDLGSGVKASIVLEPGQRAKAHMAYGSQGMDTWSYHFSQDGSVCNVKDFQADVRTNTSGIDFPSGCVSPTSKASANDGLNLQWKYANLVSGFNIGISMPHKLNPGPFAAKLSYFAPVSLFFFFSVMLILTSIKGIRLHPMHYAFLAAAFFAFNLLFSYMVDHVVPLYSFLISAAVSLLLTITYLRLAVNWKFAIFQAGLWQLIFLVLFAYAFFFEGYTGLTITIGAILTLAVMMQVTGRVNWDERRANP